MREFDLSPGAKCKIDGRNGGIVGPLRYWDRISIEYYTHRRLQTSNQQGIWLFDVVGFLLFKPLNTGDLCVRPY